MKRKPKTVTEANRADLIERTTSTLSKAAAIEPDDERRRILNLANCVRLARAAGRASAWTDAFGQWFVFKSTASELREIAKALDKTKEQIDGRQVNIANAYMAALEQSDLQFDWRKALDLNMPGKRFVLSSAVGFTKFIKSPPTLRLVRKHFVRIYRKALLPDDRSLRKTITEFFRLPLGEDKRGRPKNQEPGRFSSS